MACVKFCRLAVGTLGKAPHGGAGCRQERKVVLAHRRLLRSVLSGIVAAVGLAGTGSLPAQLAFTQLPANGPVRADHAVAFDTRRGVGVMFGGSVNNVAVAETWEFDGAVWTRVTPAQSPSARLRAAAAFDAARGVVVLFGGADSAGNQLDDTWTYDGTRWTRLTPAVRPSLRSGAAMAYDSDRQRVVLFGGWVPSRLDDAETWEWDGSAWTQRTPAVRPPARGAHRLVYHQALRRTLLAGGWSTPNNRTVGDCWWWDGTTWSAIAGPGPSARCDMSVVFDPVRASVVLFGGLLTFVGTTPVLTNDTWEYAGSWVQRTPQGTVPTPRAYAEAMWDQVRGVAVIAGGFDGAVARGESFAISSVNPARTRRVGAGCVGGVGVPSLDPVPFRLPWLGGSYAVSITGAAPTASQALLWLGASTTAWNGVGLPLDLSFTGLLGCTLFVSMDASALVPLNNGIAVLQGTLCPCPGQVGRKLYLQALVLDATAPRPVPGAITNGLELQYGLR